MHESRDSEESRRFRHLIAELNAGSQAAASDLVREYGPCLRRAVRRKLRADLRVNWDSADFAQAVWTSFFSADSLRNGIRTPEHLMRLLTVMARNKVADEERRRNSGKFGRRRIRPLGDKASGPELVSNDPTPSEIAMAKERFDGLSKGEPKRRREMLALRAKGLTYQEIADHMGVSDRTIQRAFDRFRRDFENEEGPAKGNNSGKG